MRVKVVRAGDRPVATREGEAGSARNIDWLLYAPPRLGLPRWYSKKRPHVTFESLPCPVRYLSYESCNSRHDEMKVKDAGYVLPEDLTFTIKNNSYHQPYVSRHGGMHGAKFSSGVRHRGVATLPYIRHSNVNYYD